MREQDKLSAKPQVFDPKLSSTLNSPNGLGIHRGSVGEVFTTFLKLGCTSFGGPVAHLGYFQTELVQKRGWVSAGQYAQLMSICQFLPGPASSQLGFALGLLRAGWGGALAAFVGFTLPSVLLLVGFAALLPWLQGGIDQAMLHGLKLVAAAVVAHAVLAMWQKLCPDYRRRAIALLALLAVVLLPSLWTQLATVVLAAIVGVWSCAPAASAEHRPVKVSFGAPTAWCCLAVFVSLLLLLPLAAGTAAGVEGSVWAVADMFYRAGALVFGGGHVVLPLLQESVVDGGWLDESSFLAGYGAAQAMPGPLFAFAAYLGALMPEAPSPIFTSIIALTFIFLPGFLLLCATLPSWHWLSSKPAISRALAGVNAAVVGLLAAALYDPIIITGVVSAWDLVIVLVGFAMLSIWRLSLLWVVGWCLLASTVVSVLIH